MTYLAELIRGVQTAGLKLQNPPRKNTAGVPDWRPAGEVTTERRRTSRLTANITPACPAIYPQIVTAMSLTGLKVGPGETSTALLSFRVKKKRKMDKKSKSRNILLPK